MSGDRIPTTHLLLDVFERAAAPMTASAAAKAAGVDPISGTAAVYTLFEWHRLVKVNDRKPFCYELATRASERRLRLPVIERPTPGAHTPFGLICGGAP